MKKKKTIFEILFEKKVCYAVLVNIIQFKNLSIEYWSNEFCIIIDKRDLKKVGNTAFYQNKEYDNIFEYNLNDNEITKFKLNMNNYVKVKYTEHGRVYELKNNSFKKKYETSKILHQENLVNKLNELRNTIY